MGLQVFIPADMLDVIKNMIPFASNQQRDQLININFSMEEDSTEPVIWAADGYAIAREQTQGIKFKGDWKDFGIEAKGLKKLITTKNKASGFILEIDFSKRKAAVKYGDPKKVSETELEAEEFTLKEKLEKVFLQEDPMIVKSSLSALMPLSKIINAIPTDSITSFQLHLDQKALFIEPEPNQFGEIFLEGACEIPPEQWKRKKTDNIGFCASFFQQTLEFFRFYKQEDLRISITEKLSPAVFSLEDNEDRKVALMPMSIIWKSRLESFGSIEKREMA